MDKDKLYIRHILEAITKIRRYVQDVSFDKFKDSDLIQDAVMRELEIIGEASRHISEPVKAKYPNIPWQEIGGMRNKLIHDYFGVDVEVVWKTTAEDLQTLSDKLSEEK